MYCWLNQSCLLVLSLPHTFTHSAIINAHSPGVSHCLRWAKNNFGHSSLDLTPALMSAHELRISLKVCNHSCQVTILKCIAYFYNHNLKKVSLPFSSHCNYASLILLLSNSLQDNKFSPLLLVLFYFASLFLHDYKTLFSYKGLSNPQPSDCVMK